jgi:histidyl-tRNA synthetase
LLRLESHCGGGSLKSQFKKADKSGARLALILGDEEISSNSVGVKFLREEGEQRLLSQDEVTQFLADYLASADI